MVESCAPLEHFPALQSARSSARAEVDPALPDVARSSSSGWEEEEAPRRMKQSFHLPGLDQSFQHSGSFQIIQSLAAPSEGFVVFLTARAGG